MNTPRTVTDIIYLFIDLANTIYPVLTGLAFLVFLWGLVKFIAVAGDEKNVREGKNLMVWGLITLFLMVSFGAILEFLSNEFGFSYGLPLLPQR